MTMISSMTVDCPQCSTSQEVTVYQTINVSLNPELKEPLIQRELTRFQCSQCARTTQLEYELLYHDMQRQYFIQMQRTLPGEKETPPRFPAGYQCRVVPDLIKLSEKILILDADCEDEVIEVIKLGIVRFLLTHFRGPLQKMKEIPLEAHRLVFLQRVEENGHPHLHFLFLRLHDPVLPFLVLSLPEQPALEQAQECLRQTSNEEAERQERKQRRHVSRGWAKARCGDRMPEVEVQVRVDPMMLVLPFPAGLLKEQRERGDFPPETVQQEG